MLQPIINDGVSILLSQTIRFKAQNRSTSARRVSNPYAVGPHSSVLIAVRTFLPTSCAFCDLDSGALINTDSPLSPKWPRVSPPPPEQIPNTFAISPFFVFFFFFFSATQKRDLVSTLNRHRMLTEHFWRRLGLYRSQVCCAGESYDPNCSIKSRHLQISKPRSLQPRLPLGLAPIRAQPLQSLA